MNERSPLSTLLPTSSGRRSRSARSGSISRESVVAGGLLLLPVALFATVWSTYAVNIPKWDDHALRAFLYYSEQETTLWGKLYQLLRQHNEHRIVYDRLITLLDYVLFGKLNFRHLMVVGNLSLLGLLGLFMAVLHRHNRPVLYALPVAWLLFNLSQWENMFWGMASLQNFSVVLWVLAAIYVLTYTPNWRLALLPAVLATLTSGNGLLIWPIGFGLLLLRSGEARRRPLHWALRPLAGWSLAALLVIGCYFLGFEKPADIAYVRPGPVALLKGWLAVLGAAAEALPIGRPLPASVLLGGGLLLATVGIIGLELLIHRLTISRIFQKLLRPASITAGPGTQLPAITLFFWGCVAFVLGTAAVVAWARTGFGADLLITSRYKPYSLTLLALLYLYAVVATEKPVSRWLMTAGTIGAVFFAAFSYASFLDETIWWRHWLLTNQFNWTYTTNRPVATLDPITQRYTDPAPAFYDKALPVIFGPTNQPHLRLAVEPTPRGYQVREDSLPKSDFLDAGAYMVARSDRRTYLFPVWANGQSLLQARFLPNRLFTTGFRSDIWFSDLTAGTYQLYVLTVSAGHESTLYPTHQTIRSVSNPTGTKIKNW